MTTIVCPECYGKGHTGFDLEDTTECAQCEGSGKIEQPLTQAEVHVLGFLDQKPGIKAGSFTNALIECLFAADPINFGKLHKVFPEYANAVKSWQLGDLAQRAGVE